MDLQQQDISTLRQTTTREEVQDHLNAVNKALHDHTEAEGEKWWLTPAELADRDRRLFDANARFKQEHQWLWEHGYPMYTSFQYDKDTDSYMFPVEPGQESLV